MNNDMTEAEGRAIKVSDTAALIAELTADIDTWKARADAWKGRAERAEASLQRARFLARQHEAGVPTLVDLLDLLNDTGPAAVYSTKASAVGPTDGR